MAINPRQMLGLGNTRPSMQFQQLNPAFQSDPRRILGQTLMGQGTSSAPVRTPLEGLGRLSSALVGAYLQRKAGDEAVSREDKARDALLASLPANASPMLRGMVESNPSGLQTAMASSALQPVTTAFTESIEGAPGAVGYGTKTTNQLTGAESTAFSGIYKPTKAAKQDFVTLTKADGTEPKTLPLGDAQIETLLGQGYIERQGGAAPTVNITQEGDKSFETTFRKGEGTIQVEQLRAVSKQAEDAAINVDSIESILTLYNRAEKEGVNLAELTGPGAEFKLNLKEAAADIAGLFGISIDDMGFDVDKITDQQTLRSAFNRLSLEMTKLLKGAISEKELKIASNATANFGNTAEANRMILLTQRAAAVKARLVESEMLNYKDAIGNLGRGTYNGKEYNSFTQFKREFVNQDKEFIVKQVVPEINSIAEMNALVKISGGLDNLTDETVALMDERLAQF